MFVNIKIMINLNNGTDINAYKKNRKIYFLVEI